MKFRHFVKILKGLGRHFELTIGTSYALEPIFTVPNNQILKNNLLGSRLVSSNLVKAWTQFEPMHFAARCLNFQLSRIAVVIVVYFAHRLVPKKYRPLYSTCTEATASGRFYIITHKTS